MLREHEKYFGRNKLWVVQGRLATSPNPRWLQLASPPKDDTDSIVDNLTRDSLKRECWGFRDTLKKDSASGKIAEPTCN
jgi:hypothetical protein